MNPIKLLVVTSALLSQTAFAAFLPVCQRTPGVVAALETHLSKPCAEITADDLLTLKRVAVNNRQIKAFKPDDFTGLTNVEILNIRSNPYTELPEGLMTDLIHLKTLVIIGTQLRGYPNDYLANNPEVENLHTFNNQVRTISESVLKRLEGMQHLKVLDFEFELQPAEQERLTRIFPSGGPVELNFN